MNGIAVNGPFDSFRIPTIKKSEDFGIISELFKKMVKCSQTNLKGGHLINQFINSSFMMLYVFIEKEGLTERAILLCKLNKSLLESSISVGIHRQKSLNY